MHASKPNKIPRRALAGIAATALVLAVAGCGTTTTTSRPALSHQQKIAAEARIAQKGWTYEETQTIAQGLHAGAPNATAAQIECATFTTEERYTPSQYTALSQSAVDKLGEEEGHTCK